MSPRKHRPTQVYAAAAANLFIAASKFVVAGISGSPAMLSEGFHSVADTGNEILLLLGLTRAERPPDEDHPFGHGQEVYFWSFVVAMVLFGVGGILSIYEGIDHFRRPQPEHYGWWNYVVLGIAAAAENWSLRVAWQKFHKSIDNDETLWHAIRVSKDPSVFLVVAEDIAALVGIAIALVGVGLSQRLASPVPDAIAAMAIGGVLVIVAILMVRETKALLLGEAAHPEITAAIQDIVRRDPLVSRAGRPLTMHFGPEEILVNMSVEFHPNASSDAIIQSIHRVESDIRSRFKLVRHIFIEAGAIRRSEWKEPAAIPPSDV